MKEGDTVQLTQEGWEKTQERVLGAGERRRKVGKDNIPYIAWLAAIKRGIGRPLTITWVDEEEQETIMAEDSDGRLYGLFYDTVTSWKDSCMTARVGGSDGTA